MQARAKTVCHFLVARSLHVNFVFLRCHALLVLPMGSRSCVFSSSLGGELQLPQHTETDFQDGREALWIFGETGVGMSRRAPLAALMVTSFEEPQVVVEARGSRSCFFNSSFVSKGQFPQHMLKSALDERDEWLWDHRHQIASILIFAAGGSEVFRLPNTGWLSPSPKEVESEVFDRMGEHKFDSNVPASFLISTPATCEDSWTSKSNGVIICSEQIDLDEFGFLIKGKSDKFYHQQRQGRVGRVADSVVLHLKDEVEPVSKWVMPYAERLQVRLAAMDLGVVGELPDLSAAQQEEAEVDLVIHLDD